ncbi:MAG TPA: ATPase domain-containing protein [Phycisphaerales bacterium]|nr:ATPase domain-containing protein [Phycisphaerales bacterium]
MPENRDQIVTTGVQGLDIVLNGGLPAGHVYLVEGTPGSGKTTISLQFLLEGVKRGEKALYITLSETRMEIEKIARSHGWDIKGIEIFDLAASLGTITEEDQYTVFRPSEVELGETSKKIADEIEKHKPTRVVIDSLSEIRLLARDPLRYRRQVLGFKHFFIGRGSTVLLIDDMTAADGDDQPQSIVHGLIQLDRVGSDYGAERRRIRVVKLRGAAFRGGHHDLLINRGGIEVFPRLVSSLHEVQFEDRPASSGVAELDQLLGGGVDRGTSTLITGPAGTGKSAIATQFAYTALKRGEKVAVFAFEENQRIACRRSKALGMDIEPFIKNGQCSFRHTDPAELSPGEFAALVRRSVEQDGVTVVVIDSLNGYLNAMPEERFLTAQLHELLAYLNHRGVVTLMVLVQRGMMGAGMAPPVDVSYLSDTIILLRHFEAFGAVRKAISVVKKRSGSHEDTIRELRFEPGRVRVGETLERFRGVLTGVPMYVGTEGGLMKDDRVNRAPESDV